MLDNKVPGFIVGENFGVGVNSNDIRPFYSYTWQIVDLFGSSSDKPINNRSPVILAKDITMPSWTLDIEKVAGASLEYKFAKSISWDNIKITWYDTESLVDIINDWRGMLWSPKDGIKLADDYKRKSIIRAFPFDWDVAGAATWELINSWPGAVKTGDLTYTTSNIKIIDVIVMYDWAEETNQELRNKTE